MRRHICSMIRNILSLRTSDFCVTTVDVAIVCTVRAPKKCCLWQNELDCRLCIRSPCHVKYCNNDSNALKEIKLIKLRCIKFLCLIAHVCFTSLSLSPLHTSLQHILPSVLTLSPSSSSLSAVYLLPSQSLII